MQSDGIWQGENKNSKMATSQVLFQFKFDPELFEVLKNRE
jgi:hypothetical protein